MLKPSQEIRIYDPSITDETNFFKGTMNHKNLQWDPLVVGFAFIIWTKLPQWIVDQFGTGAKHFMEKNFQSFSGLSDIEMQTSPHSFGFTAQEYEVPTTIQKGNTEFILKMQEFSGSPVKNIFQYWVSGIRDPETGIATYAAKANVDYSAKNHTGELLYIVTRPDANNVKKKNIEFAAFYTNVFPTKIPLSHFNYEKGSHDLQEIEIPFKATLHISPAVDSFAKKKLNDTYYFREENEFDPTNPNAGGTKNGEGVNKPSPTEVNTINGIKDDIERKSVEYGPGQS